MRWTILSLAPSSYKFDAIPRLNPCQPCHSSRRDSTAGQTTRWPSLSRTHEGRDSAGALGVESRSLVVGFVFPVRGSQKVIQDKVCYIAAQALSSRQVKSAILPTEDPAQPCFFGGCRTAFEASPHSRKTFGYHD